MTSSPCCAACTAGRSCESGGVPLIYAGRKGYIEVARKAQLRADLLALGGLDVSAAIPMDEANSITADCAVQVLSLGGTFTLGVDASNDVEVWHRTAAQIFFLTPGKNVLTLTGITMRYIRLRYVTTILTTATFAAGVRRWKR